MASSNLRLHASFALLVLALAWLPAHAQSQQIADLSIDVQPTLPRTPLSGTLRVLTITVSNNGPDDAGLTSSSSHPLAAYTSLQDERPDGGHDVYLFPSYPVDDCRYFVAVVDPVPGGVPQWGYGLDFPPILVGESVSCSLRYKLDEDVADRAIPIVWSVATFTETDPNPDNNSVEVIFNVAGGEPQTTVPVPGLQLFALSILLLTTLMLGAAAVSRPSNT